MYLSYDEYIGMVLDPLTEAEYKVIEPDAEILLDSWTFDRLKVMDEIPLEAKRVLAKMVNGVYDMEQGAKALMAGESVKSYSNGVSSWSFDTPYTGSLRDYRQMCRDIMYQMALDALPIDLITQVVSDCPGCGCWQ